MFCGLNHLLVYLQLPKNPHLTSFVLPGLELHYSCSVKEEEEEEEEEEGKENESEKEEEEV